MIRPTATTGNALLLVTVSARFDAAGKPVEWFDLYCRAWHPVVDGWAECPRTASIEASSLGSP